MKLIYGPNLALKQKCIDFSETELLDHQNLTKLSQNMLALMHKSNGVGLAGPQVGLHKSIFVMAPANKEYALINPKIISVGSEDRVRYSLEQCLSFPDLEPVPIQRYQSINVEYFTVTGEKVIQTFENLESVVVQHENEHLQGKTIFDYLSPLKQSRYSQKMRKFKKSLIKQLKQQTLTK